MIMSEVLENKEDQLHEPSLKEFLLDTCPVMHSTPESFETTNPKI